MKPLRLVLALAIAVLSAPTFTLAADAEAGLAAVKDLGSVNGQALACSEAALAAHAPKTQRFGAAYEEATQEAFLAQTRAAGTCPDAMHLTDRLNQLALRLADTLPVVAPAAK
jgi:hypothetical protein